MSRPTATAPRVQREEVKSFGGFGKKKKQGRGSFDEGGRRNWAPQGMRKGNGGELKSRGNGPSSLGGPTSGDERQKENRKKMKDEIPQEAVSGGGQAQSTKRSL